MSEKDSPITDGTFQYYDARRVDEIHYKNARDEGAILRTLKTPEERANFLTDVGTLKSIQIDLITLLKNKDSDTRLEFFLEFPYQGGFAAALSWAAPYTEFPHCHSKASRFPPIHLISCDIAITSVVTSRCEYSPTVTTVGSFERKSCLPFRRVLIAGRA